MTTIAPPSETELNAVPRPGSHRLRRRRHGGHGAHRRRTRSLRRPGRGRSPGPGGTRRSDEDPSAAGPRVAEQPGRRRVRRRRWPTVHADAGLGIRTVRPEQPRLPRRARGGHHRGLPPHRPGRGRLPDRAWPGLGRSASPACSAAPTGSSAPTPPTSCRSGPLWTGGGEADRGCPSPTSAAASVRRCLDGGGVPGTRSSDTTPMRVDRGCAGGHHRAERHLRGRDGHRDPGGDYDLITTFDALHDWVTRWRGPAHRRSSVPRAPGSWSSRSPERRCRPRRSAEVGSQGSRHRPVRAEGGGRDPGLRLQRLRVPCGVPPAPPPAPARRSGCPSRRGRPAGRRVPALRVSSSTYFQNPPSLVCASTAQNCGMLSGCPGRPSMSPPGQWKSTESRHGTVSSEDQRLEARAVLRDGAASAPAMSLIVAAMSTFDSR